MVPNEICGVLCLHPGAVERARTALGRVRTESLAEIFRALSDPTRVGILTALSAGELCVCDLADLFGVTPGAISHQLRLLKGVRLVRARREGKIVFYRLDDDHVARLFAEAAGHAAETSR